MDHLDHALGRPAWPLVESHRNHFAVDANSALAAEMTSSPFWSGPKIRDTMAYFFVNDQGRAALAAHLREIGDPHRVYEVTTKPGEIFEGKWTNLIVAPSASKARYSAFLQATDVYELKFVEFQKNISVRLAASPEARS
ncbi:hypothetical protein ACQZ4Q_08285 [Agrobacterium vitis]